MVRCCLKKSKHMLTETNIIQTLKRAFPTHIGDDAAVLPATNHDHHVITQDLLVEDVHFRRKYHSAATLAHKALHVNLSDLAAMGAFPDYVLLGLSIPPTLSEDYLNEFLNHFTHACHTQHVTLIGGDTTASPDTFFISVTALGHVDPANIKHRHTAKPGDVICVTGPLGEAHVGFTTLERGEIAAPALTSAFLTPNARVSEGIWLGKQTAVTAMMDLSDGLFTDLEKLAIASNSAALINVDHFILTPSFKSACQHLQLDPISTQLIGGEDYGLLLTLKPEHYTTLHAAFKNQFGYSLQTIGHMRPGAGVQVIQHDQPFNLQLTPFSHF